VNETGFPVQPYTPDPPECKEDFALQDDGKVAWLQRRNVEAAPVAVAWASPAEPWAHVVARDVAIGGVPIGA
jgi:hypothetical protein